MLLLFDQFCVYIQCLKLIFLLEPFPKHLFSIGAAESSFGKCLLHLTLRPLALNYHKCYQYIKVSEHDIL